MEGRGLRRGKQAIVFRSMSMWRVEKRLAAAEAFDLTSCRADELEERGELEMLSLPSFLPRVSYFASRASRTVVDLTRFQSYPSEIIFLLRSVSFPTSAVKNQHKLDDLNSHGSRERSRRAPCLGRCPCRHAPSGTW